ncbi:MAG: Trypsin-like peptidase protein [Pseudonocardiales bacterium]|nr:Trypsin-like peptidase protein [Pseudonocardiales bacterium]
MDCGRCGGYASERDLFCPHCGTPVESLPPAGGPHGAPTEPPHAGGAERGSARLPVLMAGLVAVIIVGATSGAVAVLHNGTVDGHPVAVRGVRASIGPSVAATKTVTVSPTAVPTMDFATIYTREQSGVVRIETLSCSDAGIGTGFLLSPTLIATVNHVVDQSVVVSLIDGAQRTTGTVIGSDPAHDLALVQANRPLTGFHFRFATSAPSIGDQVAAIGFPIGNPITLTHGDVSGLDRNITVNGTALTGMVETDTAINPGNSGGPLINQYGTVVGLIDALQTNANGIGYAVPANQASAAIQRWQQAPSPVPPAACPNPLGPSQAVPNVPTPPTGQITDAQAAGIVAAFNTYFGGINTGDYASAYAVLSPRLQGGASEQQFANGDATSYDSGLTVIAAQAVDATTVHVALAFTSLQTADKGPSGDTCDNWTLLYTMIQGADGSWLIDSTGPYNGMPEHTAC